MRRWGLSIDDCRLPICAAVFNRQSSIHNRQSEVPGTQHMTDNEILQIFRENSALLEATSFSLPACIATATYNVRLCCSTRESPNNCAPNSLESCRAWERRRWRRRRWVESWWRTKWHGRWASVHFLQSGRRAS